MKLKQHNYPILNEGSSPGQALTAPQQIMMRTERKSWTGFSRPGSRLNDPVSTDLIAESIVSESIPSMYARISHT